jgi:hypothetical protein
MGIQLSDVEGVIFVFFVSLLFFMSLVFFFYFLSSTFPTPF